MSNILTNTSSLQAILEALQNKAAGGGNSEPNLPILTNEGSASDMLFGKQLIDSDGNIVTGTFSLDKELNTQDGLIAQIQAAIDSLPEVGNGSSGDSGGTIETCTITVETDKSSSKLGVRMVDGLPVPIYQEESNRDMTWEAPCGSIVAVAYPFGDNNICVNATYLGHDDGTYVPSFIMGSLLPVHLFRIDAKAGEAAKIQMYDI